MTTPKYKIIRDKVEFAPRGSGWTASLDASTIYIRTNGETKARAYRKCLRRAIAHNLVPVS